MFTLSLIQRTNALLPLWLLAARLLRSDTTPLLVIRIRVVLRSQLLFLSDPWSDRVQHPVRSTLSAGFQHSVDDFLH